MYLAWYDDDRKKSAFLKIMDGVSRYKERFGTPNVVLISIEDFQFLEKDEIPEDARWLEFRARAHVPQNNFFIGFEEKEIQAKAS